ATDEQADFPIVYACARDGWCTLDMDSIGPLVRGEMKGDLSPLFDLILEHVPEPRSESEPGFRMQITNLAYSEYVGQLAIGRILRGSIRRGQEVVRHGVNKEEAAMKETFQVARLYSYDGLTQVEREE